MLIALTSCSGRQDTRPALSFFKAEPLMEYPLKFTGWPAGSFATVFWVKAYDIKLLRSKTRWPTYLVRD